MKEFIQRIIRSWKGVGLHLNEEERKVNLLESDAERKKEIIRSAAACLPKKYSLGASLLVEALHTNEFTTPTGAYRYLLSNAKKVNCTRKPLPIKEKYGYCLWQFFREDKKELIDMLSSNKRLVEIQEGTLELSAAKADILILSSGGDYFDVNHLLSEIDLTYKYVIICSAFSEKKIRKHVLYRVDKTINPYKITDKLANFDFIEEIIQEATDT